MRQKKSGMFLWAFGLILILFPACTDSSGRPVDGGPNGTPTDKSVWDYSMCILKDGCPREYTLLGVSTLSACASSWTWTDAYLANRQGDSFAALYFADREGFERIRNCEEYSAWDLCSEEELALFGDDVESASCRDNKILRCIFAGPFRAVRHDCASAGLTCVDGLSPQICGLGSCDEETFENGCEEEVLTRCEGGQIRTTDCGGSFFSYGAHEFSDGSQVSNRCGERSDGIMGCIGEGADCDENSFERHCDGSVMETCTGGQIARLDCNDLIPGSVCEYRGGETMRCLPADPECDGSMDDICEDGRITFCDFGEWVRIDCREAGFSGCKLVSAGSFSYAVCTP